MHPPVGVETVTSPSRFMGGGDSDFGKGPRPRRGLMLFPVFISAFQAASGLRDFWHTARLIEPDVPGGGGTQTSIGTNHQVFLKAIPRRDNGSENQMTDDKPKPKVS